MALAPAGTRIYAVGDIHGRADLLDRMLGDIARDACRSRAPRRLVVFLGDYVDRGPDSRRVVETLAAGPPPTPHWAGFSWICLKGNHEEAMIQFLSNTEVGPGWLANGALPTIESYAGPTRHAGLDHLQDRLADSLPDSHRRFLEALPLWHAEGDYFFVHAGVRPGVPLALQQSRDLLWIRREFLTSPEDHGKVIVHGHTVVRNPETHSNRIAIDTGAVASGRLSALVAEGAECHFLST